VNLVTADPVDSPTCDCDGQITGLVVREATTGPAEQALPAPEAEHTTWWPVDLQAVLTGVGGQPLPVMLLRTDGSALLYRGKVNGLLGESESGKTWVALLATAQVLLGGGVVVYLDFEDAPAGIVERLRALGVPDEALARLHYIGPDETLHQAASEDLAATLAAAQPDLIVVDGFNAAMTLLGLEINDNGDATKFSQKLLSPLAATGATVLYVDHIPKAREGRGKGGIGAQAKRAMTTGCALLVEILEPFGRGMNGRIHLTVDKDRPGHVRALSAAAREVGTMVLESDRESGAVNARIVPPDTATPVQRATGQRVQLKEAISAWLATAPEKTSRRACLDAVPGDDHAVGTALQEMVEDGFVRRVDLGLGRGFVHELIRPFTVAEYISGQSGVGEVGEVGCGEGEVPPHPKWHSGVRCAGGPPTGGGPPHPPPAMDPPTAGGSSSTSPPHLGSRFWDQFDDDERADG
jgi:hypothetical protein